MTEGELLKANEVQRILGVSRWTFYELVARRELPVLRLGRRVRVPRTALYRWIEARTTDGSGSEAA